jgi:hypothetical protein
LAESFARAWLPFLESQGILPDWKTRYGHLILQQKSGPGPTHEQEMATEEIEDDRNSEEEDNEKEYQEEDIYNTFDLDD